MRMYSQEFRGGVLLGATTSQIQGDYIGGFYKFGPTAGFFVQRELTSLLDISYELRYSSKGSGDGMGNFKIHIGYAEIPVLLRYQVNSHFGVKGGVSASFRIFETTTVDFITSSTSDFWIWDAPIHVGLDYKLSETWVCDMRYSFSTFPISYRYQHWCIYLAMHYYLR